MAKPSSHSYAGQGKKVYPPMALWATRVHIPPPNLGGIFVIYGEALSGLFHNTFE